MLFPYVINPALVNSKLSGQELDTELLSSVSIQKPKFDFVSNVVIPSFTNAEISQDLLAALGKVDKFPTDSLDFALHKLYSNEHSDLVNIAYKNIFRFINLCESNDADEFLALPLDSLLQLHWNSPEIFEHFSTELGWPEKSSWKIFTELSKAFEEKIADLGLKYNEVKVKLSAAGKYANYLYNNFSHFSISDTVIDTLEGLSVIKDLQYNPFTGKLADEHIRVTVYSLVDNFINQRELVRPIKDNYSVFCQTMPAFLETLYIKPDVFVNAESLRKQGIVISDMNSYLKFHSSLQCLILKDLEKHLPDINPRLAMACIRKAQCQTNSNMRWKYFSHYTLCTARAAMTAARIASGLGF